MTIYWLCDKCRESHKIMCGYMSDAMLFGVFRREHGVHSKDRCEFDPDQIRVKLTPFKPAIRCLDVQAEDTRDCK